MREAKQRRESAVVINAFKFGFKRSKNRLLAAAAHEAVTRWFFSFFTGAFRPVTHSTAPRGGFRAARISLREVDTISSCSEGIFEGRISPLYATTPLSLLLMAA